MRAIIYDQVTGITLFDRKLSKGEKGKFEAFLSEKGFVYEPQFDSWAHNVRKHTAVIYINN
jgi:hypothetical protein